MAEPAHELELDPVEDPIAAERREQPPGGLIQRFTSQHGGTIRYAFWKQPSDQPRARAFVLNGRTEFIEKQHEVIRELLRRNFEVWAMDWRGQGLSSRELTNHHKGYVRDFQHYVDDLGKLLGIAARERADAVGRVPAVVVAHSMGAHVALRFAQQQPGQIAAMLLCAPMVDINLTGPQRPFAAAMAGLHCACALGGTYVPATGDYHEDALRFEGNLLTTDPSRYWESAYWIRRNPELAIGGPTYGWLRAALRSIRMLRRPQAAARVTIPVRMMSAADDVVVSNAAQKALAKALPKALFFSIAGARHELLHESDPIRALVWEQFDRLTAEFWA